MREKNILWISLHGAEKLCLISFGYANIIWTYDIDSDNLNNY